MHCNACMYNIKLQLVVKDQKGFSHSRHLPFNFRPNKSYHVNRKIHFGSQKTVRFSLFIRKKFALIKHNIDKGLIFVNCLRLVAVMAFVTRTHF